MNSTALNTFTAWALEHFLKDDVSFFVNPYLSEWVDHMKSIDPARVSPSHNPEVSSVTPGNSGWLQLVKNGRIIGCVAGRVFPNSDLNDLIQTRRLWYETDPGFDTEMNKIDAVVTGNIFIIGGLFSFLVRYTKNNP